MYYEALAVEPSTKVPQAIATKPELTAFDSYYLSAFYVLTTSRSSGMGEGYIPLSEILNYGIFLEDDDIEVFISLIRVMDNTYLEQRQKESAKKG
jgi:hypothetical protein